MKSPQSETSVWNHLSWYYFVCCILVCFVHFSNTADIFTTEPIPWFSLLQHIEIYYLGAPIVAGFFGISGLLFSAAFSGHVFPPSGCAGSEAFSFPT